MHVERTTHIFDAEVEPNRDPETGCWLRCSDSSDTVVLFFSDNKAFLDFAAEVARIAEAIEAERLHDAPKIRHPQCKPKSLEGWRG